jgi:hypothetical protein
MKKLIICLSVLLFSVTSCKKNKQDTQTGGCQKITSIDTYKYPVLPGTDEWKQLASQSEKIAVCQLPAGVLQTISTKGLLSSILDHPLFLTFSAWDKMQDGFIYLKSQVNSLPVFFGRPGALNEVLGFYSKMLPSCPNGTYPPYNPNSTSPTLTYFSIWGVETLLYQDEFLGNISSDSSIIVFKTVYKKNKLKNETNGNLYLGDDRAIGAAIMGKLMLRDTSFTAFADYCMQDAYVNTLIYKLNLNPNYSSEAIHNIEMYAERYYLLH